MQSDFYNKLKEYKKKNKVSNADLGQIIGKNEPAMRMAINRESLSVFEIQEIEKLFVKSNKQENILDEKNLIDLLKAKDKIIELMERNETANNEIKDLRKLIEGINKTVSFNSISLDEIKEYWTEYYKAKLNN